MIKVQYLVNYELFTAYFADRREMLEYEHSVIKDGDTIQIFTPETRVTIFDVKNDYSLNENDKLEIIVKSLYPTKKFENIFELNDFARERGLI